MDVQVLLKYLQVLLVMLMVAVERASVVIQNQLIKQDQYPQSKEEQITQLFFTFVTNLVKKGGSAMIHLLGDFLGVSVDNQDPDQLIDEFNARLRDPEMQLKLLQMKILKK